MKPQSKSPKAPLGLVPRSLEEIEKTLTPEEAKEYETLKKPLANMPDDQPLYPLIKKMASDYLKKIETDRITELNNQRRDEETAKLRKELADRDERERAKEEHYRLFGEARSGDTFKYGEAGEAAKLLAPYIEAAFVPEFNSGLFFGYEATGWESVFGWGVTISGLGCSVNRTGGEPYKHRIMTASWSYDKDTEKLSPMKSFKGFFTDIPKGITASLKKLLPYIVRKKKEAEEEKEEKEEKEAKPEKKREAKANLKAASNAKKQKIKEGIINVDEEEDTDKLE